MFKNINGIHAHSKVAASKSFKVMCIKGHITSISFNFIRYVDVF